MSAKAAVTSATVGSMVGTVSAGSVPVSYAGVNYEQCASTWYQPQGALTTRSSIGAGSSDAEARRVEISKP